MDIVRQSRYNGLTLLFAGLILVFLINGLAFGVTWASSDLPDTAASRTDKMPQKPMKSWYKNIDVQWGGHIKAYGSVSWPDDESFFKPVGIEPCYDGHTEARVKNKLFFGDWGELGTHYEAIFSGGDTRRKWKLLQQLYPDIFTSSSMFGRQLEDDRRFMNLTKTIDEDESHILYHRLDRLAMTVLPEWGTVRVGRQAVTWGNGLLFNPMDLFNPFSPADFERDYKIGDDMVFTQFVFDSRGELQLLYVPRREVTTEDVEWDQSSLAGKLHFGMDTTEFDIMLAKHYKDEVIGVGSTGYLGNGAWRLDSTWTFLNSESDTDGYLSVVADMDYSWVWWGKNFYGFLEFYLNGLSHNQYTEVFTDLDIVVRINRGELYTLGRTYLGGHVRVELHPLFNVYVTVIENLGDPSGTIQPRAVWDVAKDVQITFGGTTHYGSRGTEYGGFTIPGTNLLYMASDNALLWLTYFF